MGTAGHFYGIGFGAADAAHHFDELLMLFLESLTRGQLTVASALPLYRYAISSLLIIYHFDA